MIAADEDQPALEVSYTTQKQCKIILVQHVILLQHASSVQTIFTYKQEYNL